MKPYEKKFLTLLIISEVFIVIVPLLGNTLRKFYSDPQQAYDVLKTVQSASFFLGQIPSMLICGLWLRRKEVEQSGNPTLWFFAGCIFAIHGLLLHLGYRILSKQLAESK